MKKVDLVFLSGIIASVIALAIMLIFVLIN